MIKTTDASEKNNQIPALENDRPQPGDRVKICGNHRYAGYSGQYLGDFPVNVAMSSTRLPRVKIFETGETVWILVPDRQMRKV